MSQENVEIVRGSFLAVSGGDPMAAPRFYDPAIEWDMSGVTGWVEKPVYRGREVIPFLQAWADSWQDWHFDVDEVRDGDGERVFAAIHEWGIGGDTGVHVDQRRYFAVTLRGGRAVRVQMFSERDHALTAVGLKE
ncbi:MAG TPA: nuclear transport factor 2 family protein [Solirubrobacteraceae bacterium]|nr:nuclear transport factor 2 family protein [Solirubrobacteraceae bacterium]